jgi:predicted lipoprotein with Yx(FWY)xxD motif
MITDNVTRYAFGVTAALVSAVVLAACSSSGSPTPAGSSGSGGSSAATSGLKTQSTSIGTVTTDASGHTLYELVGDTTASPKCTGTCLSVWPAVMANGTQVVLQGHPAFTFSGDTAAGQVKGQGVTDQWGTWYALDSKGAPITSSTAPTGGTSSSSSGGSGGYGY